MIHVWYSERRKHCPLSMQWRPGGLVWWQEWEMRNRCEQEDLHGDIAQNEDKFAPSDGQTWCHLVQVWLELNVSGEFSQLKKQTHANLAPASSNQSGKTMFSKLSQPKLWCARASRLWEQTQGGNDELAQQSI